MGTQFNLICEYCELSALNKTRLDNYGAVIEKLLSIFNGSQSLFEDW